MSVRSLLVTNDFPPKIGGIQSYLGELWDRMGADETVVYAPRQADAAVWDAQRPWPVVRSSSKYMLAVGRLTTRIDALVAQHRPDVVLVDPAIMVGPAMTSRRRGSSVPWAPILHGGEVTVPGRITFLRPSMRKVLNSADFVVAAGGFPLAEAEAIVGHSLDAVLVSPGVDTNRFVPLGAAERRAVRQRWGIPDDAFFVLGLSRLVPRKGFDVLIRAAHRIAGSAHGLVVGIGGTGRDEDRLRRLARGGSADIRLLGRVPEDDLAALYGASDAFAMLCRNRWNNWEQEGFGIVFLEAAACAVPSLAGRSGGSHEAVSDENSGLLVQDPSSVDEAARALRRLADDAGLRRRLGDEARRRAVTEFDYSVLVDALRQGLAARVGRR